MLHRKTLSLVLKRMVHRSAGMALDTWCEHATEQAKMREASRRMILRMKNMACARAFQLWSERCLEAERLRKGMERVLKHWCNTHKAAAMASLSDTLSVLHSMLFSLALSGGGGEGITVIIACASSGPGSSA